MKLYDIDESKGYPIPVMVEDPLGEYYRQDEVDPVIAALKAEITDLNHTFDMVKAADERALKMYWDAHPDKRRMVPSQVNMDIWLLEQIDRLKDVNGELVSIIEGMVNGEGLWLPPLPDKSDPENEGEYAALYGMYRRMIRALAKAKEAANAENERDDIKRKLSSALSEIMVWRLNNDATLIDENIRLREELMDTLENTSSVELDRLKDVNGKMVETVRDILDAFWDMSPLEYANSRNLAFMSDAEGGEILKRAREALAKAKEVGNG